MKRAASAKLGAFATDRGPAWHPTRQRRKSPFLLSFQDVHGIFEPIRERLRGPRSPLREHGLDYLAYALLDAVIDRYFVVVDHLGEAAEQLEDQALGRPEPGLLHAIKSVKHDTLLVRRAV